MRHYKSLGFKYTGFIDNFLNDNPQYEAIAITYNSDDKLYHLLYKDSAQQPVDAVAQEYQVAKIMIENLCTSYEKMFDRYAAVVNLDIDTVREYLGHLNVVKGLITNSGIFSSQTKQP